MSLAICTCRVSGSMSGARRAASNTAGSNFRCAALAAAFSRMDARLPRVCANRSADIACIETFMDLPFQAVPVGEGRSLAQTGASASRVKQCSRSPGGIEAAMNLIWTPAQLAMLAKVVDLNGFSAAARALGVPKAAVSRAVADLEKTLGVRVLEHTTRRIALTSAGRLLYPHARRVAEESDAARSAVGRLHSPDGRPLRVVADPTYGRVPLPPLLPRFLDAVTQVALEVPPDAQQPAQGTWDVVIRTHPPADETI